MRSVSPPRFSPPRRGFTLVELLVAVGIIALLIAILLPVIAGARRAAQKAHCMGNVRALTRAWEQYHSANRGQLVLTGSYGSMKNEWGLAVAWVADGPDEEGIKTGGLWPYTQTMRIYQCPADPTGRLRSYSGNAYLSGDSLSWNADRWGRKPETVMEVAGAAHPFVFTEEALAEPIPGQPTRLEAFFVPPVGDQWENYPASFHRDGVNLSFADGHCEFYKFSDARTAKIAARKTTTPNNPDLKQFQSWVGVNPGRFQTGP